MTHGVTYDVAQGEIMPTISEEVSYAKRATSKELLARGVTYDTEEIEKSQSQKICHNKVLNHQSSLILYQK